MFKLFLLFTCVSLFTDEPVTILPLTGGWSTSQLFHVATSEKHYVLRYQYRKSVRFKECYMMKQASEAGISPHVYYMDPEKGVILMDYINDAKTLSPEQAQRSETIRSLAKVLQIAHAIPKPHCQLPRLIDNVRNAYTYLADFGLIDEHKKGRMQEFEELYVELDNRSYPHTMIHGDLHVKNIFLTKDNTLLLIDWEESRFDDPFFDIVYSSCTLNYSNEQELDYLATYLGHFPNELEWQHYHLCKHISLLAAYFEMLKFAHDLNDNKPFSTPPDPSHPWSWYMQAFNESSAASPKAFSAEFFYNWTESVLSLIALDASREMRKEK